MKRYAFLSFFIVTSLLLFAQPAKQEVSRAYQATADKVNDLVHTKLDARFDYSKSQLNGKVWLTLKPQFYATDSLRLDAKGMDIHQIAMAGGSKNVPLKYKYDGEQLNITLDKKYRGGEP